MQHRASLVSIDSGDEVDVAIDVGAGRVEMLVAETSVGRWPVAAFVAAPDGDGGFQLQVDGELWTVTPGDHALFLADALPRTPLLSRARLVNRYPRLVATADMLLDPMGRRRLAWYGLVIAFSIISFVFGAIAGRYRIEGRNLLTWVLVGLLVLTSVAITRFVVRQASGQAMSRDVRWSPEPVEPQPAAPAVSRLLATLNFQTPTAIPEAEAEAVEPSTGEDIADTDKLTVSPPATDSDKDEAEAEAVEPSTGEDIADTDELTVSPPATDSEEDEATLNRDGAAEAEPTPDGEGEVAQDDPAPSVLATETTGTTANGQLRGDEEPDTPGSRIVVINIDRDPDDLTTIRGIGDTYAAVLAELGITTYQQLASIDGKTLETLRKRLGSFASRIEREQWIEHAAEAHRAKWATAHTERSSQVTDSTSIS